MLSIILVLRYKNDNFVFFEAKFLKDYKFKTKIVKYNVIFEQKSYILKYNYRSLNA